MGRTTVTENLSPSYDYIIVGGGTAGCVLANRLSEDQSTTVLLLEAGYDDKEFPEIHVPAKCSTLQQTAYDWAYKTVPQKHSCKGLKNQQMPTARGKVLGGSGSLNYMVYNRGTPYDYDRWESMGCDGWGYKDVLPYFIKSEDCRIPDLTREDSVRGVNGPMAVEESKFSVLAEKFLQAGEELGYKRTDNSGRNPIGFMVLQMNVADGKRAHTAEAFLRPAMNRANLHIATHSHVSKIIIEDKVAVGVEFVRGGSKQRVSAREEIVLSAGTIGSAQLLMLSGVGPRDHLQSLGCLPTETLLEPFTSGILFPSLSVTSKEQDWFPTRLAAYFATKFSTYLAHSATSLCATLFWEFPDLPLHVVIIRHGDNCLNSSAVEESLLSARKTSAGVSSRLSLAVLARKIPVVADLPIGNSLHDHIMVFGVEFETDGPYIPGDEVFSEENQKLYDTSLSGPIATCVCEGAAYLRTERQCPDNPNADIQVHQLSGLLSPSWKLNSGMDDEHWEAIFGDRQGKYGFTFMPRLSHPKSRGTLRLHSADFMDYPLIDPNYLSHPDDVRTLVEGIKFCVKLGKTKAYSSLGARFRNRVLPGYSGTPYTDEYWEDYVRAMTQTVYHVVGTCRMGRADDITTVTDPQLRVKGIGRLRVVDASVMPEITSGNTNAPTVMIAEKGADMIKEARAKLHRDN